MKVGLFSQLLLAESNTFPLFTDSSAKDDTVIGTGPHRYTQPQTRDLLYTAKRMILLLQWRRFHAQLRRLNETDGAKRPFGCTPTPVFYSKRTFVTAS
jgi:hypothetical protein